MIEAKAQPRFAKQIGASILAVLAFGVVVFFLTSSDLIAGLLGFVTGAAVTLINWNARFSWSPGGIKTSGKMRLIWSMRAFFAGAGLALLVMAQLWPDVSFAKWTPQEGWRTRSLGPNSHVLLSFLGAALTAAALCLPWRLRDTA